MKNLSNFTTEELINELRSREIIFLPWTIQDVDNAIETVKEWNPEYDNLELTHEQKLECLNGLFGEETDTSIDSENLERVIMRHFEEKVK